jgi:hypothetical protein
MLALFTALPSLISGLFGSINGITNAISNEKIAALTATTDQDRIAAQERVNSLSMQRDVLVADAAHSKLDLYIRSLIALGPMIVLLKIFAWDKAFGTWTGGRTDALDPNLWQVIMVVLGFYFVSATTTTVAQMFSRPNPRK